MSATRSVLALSSIAFLLLFQSLPISAHESAALIPHSRVLSRSLQEGRELLEGGVGWPRGRKLGVFIRRRSSSYRPRSGGKTSSASRTRLSRFHMKVDVKESCIIRPAKDTPKQHLWMSNLDHLLAWTHIPLVIFYKQSDSSSFPGMGVLKAALSQVLVPFYPVAGRLGRDKTGRIEIQCNAEGALFLEAEADTT